MDEDFLIGRPVVEVIGHGGERYEGAALDGGIGVLLRLAHIDETEAGVGREFLIEFLDGDGWNVVHGAGAGL